MKCTGLSSLLRFSKKLLSASSESWTYLWICMKKKPNDTTTQESSLRHLQWKEIKHCNKFTQKLNTCVWAVYVWSSSEHVAWNYYYFFATVSVCTDKNQHNLHLKWRIGISCMTYNIIEEAAQLFHCVHKCLMYICVCVVCVSFAHPLPILVLLLFLHPFMFFKPFDVECIWLLSNRTCAHAHVHKL